jgi:hypothetical protein
MRWSVGQPSADTNRLRVCESEEERLQEGGVEAHDDGV